MTKRILAKNVKVLACRFAKDGWRRNKYNYNDNKMHNWECKKGGICVVFNKEWLMASKGEEKIHNSKTQAFVTIKAKQTFMTFTRSEDNTNVL